MDSLTSKTILLLRFPLIMGVLFMHCANLPVDGYNLSIYNDLEFCKAIEVFFSRLLPSVCVPTFFFISGYLYFANIDKLSKKCWLKKTKSRFWSLVIPYILWNTTFFLIMLFINMAKIMFHGGGFNDCVMYVLNAKWANFLLGWAVQIYPSISGLPIYISFPYDEPLWFLFDLIIMSIAFTPIIYFLIKKGKCISLILVAILYVFSIWPCLPIRVDSFFFFMFGAYFSINKLNPTKSNRVFFLFAVAFLILSQLLYGNVISETIRKCYDIAGVLSLFIIFPNILQFTSIKMPKILVESVFFIYAMHEMYVLGIIQRLFEKLNMFIVDSCYIKLIEFFITPFAVLIICLVLFRYLESCCPKIMSLYDGRR